MLSIFILSAFLSSFQFYAYAGLENGTNIVINVDLQHKQTKELRGEFIYLLLVMHCDNLFVMLVANFCSY